MYLIKITPKTKSFAIPLKVSFKIFKKKPGTENISDGKINCLGLFRIFRRHERICVSPLKQNKRTSIIINI